MAKTFDIVRTERSLPGQGPGVYGNVNFDTGAAALAQGIGAFGRGMANLGATMLKIQADTEFSEATLDARRQVNEMSTFIKGNHDVEDIAEQQDQLFDALQERDFKSGLAARNYQRWLNNALPGIEQGIANQVRRVQVDDWHAIGSELQAEAVRTRNVSAVTEYYRGGVANGTISNTDATNLIRQTRHDAELRAAESFAMNFPKQALEDIKGDKFKNFPGLNPKEVLALEGIATRTLYKRSKELEAAQDKVGRDMIVALWKGELTKLDDVTNALDNNLITPTMAKYLRESILKPRQYTPLDKLLAESEVRRSIGEYQQGDITKQQALETLYQYADALGESKGSSLLDKLYDEPDPAMATMENKGMSLMEEYIRTKDPISGMFKDDKQEIMLTAKGRLLLDLEIEEAAKAGRPMGRRDIMIAAMEIGQQMRDELSTLGKKEIVPVPKDLGMKPEVGRPRTQEEFKTNVTYLRAHGWDAAAKVYYDKWVDVLWPK